MAAIIARAPEKIVHNGAVRRLLRAGGLLPPLYSRLQLDNVAQSRSPRSGGTGRGRDPIPVQGPDDVLNGAGRGRLQSTFAVCHTAAIARIRSGVHAGSPGEYHSPMSGRE